MSSVSLGKSPYGELLRFVQLFSLVLMGLFFASGSVEARTLKLVALGDSLTAGYGLAPGQGFTEQLDRALKAKGWDVEVINAGVSGDTAEDGLARFEWSVPSDADALIVELGANDMLRGQAPERARAALTMILEKAKAAHLPALLAGMKAAPNLGSAYQGKFDAIYPDLAAQYGVALYPFFLDGVAGDPKLNQKDGLHPTREGAGRIVEAILPSVEALLRRAGQ